MTKKPVYVIGHRNPDTDSICSAIAYAHLKQVLGEAAIPARAGKVNAETEYVLERFGQEAPILISDLFPRARDIMSAEVITVGPDSTLRELGQVMKRSGVKSVPVVSRGLLEGMVTVGDLAKRYFDEMEMQDLHEAGVDYASLLRTVDGTLACGGDIKAKVEGKVRIAGATTQTMVKAVEAGDILLVGDRGKAQMAAIEKGIACLVLTGGAEILPEVREAALAKGAIIIQAPYDTYTTARLINQSIPVRMIMQSRVIGFEPSDLVADIRPVIVSTNHRNYPVLEGRRLVGLINRDRLIVPERERVILVDHNEHTQAVEGIEEAQIIEIIDHHRLGGLQTGEPIFIRHDPVGSTATIVANLYWHRAVEIPPVIAGLLLAAVISDTLYFKSPTATAKDRETAVRLAGIAGLELEEFALATLKAGSGTARMAASDILGTDSKEFQIGEYRVAIAQISVLDPADILIRQSELLVEMENMRGLGQFDMCLLMITDILQETTHLLYTGPSREILSLAFGADENADGIMVLPGVMSRKKQIVPPMVEAARQLS